MSNRIFYASQGVSVGKSGTANTVQGAQSVTMNTNYNLEQVFQLGRLEVYDNVVGDPSVEVGITKVLDGKPLIYNLACGSGSIQQTANVESTVEFAVGADTVENIGDNGNITTITCDPIYLQSLTYTFPVDGDFTEEVNFVGISKTVATAAAPATPTAGSDSTQTVLRRQNFKVDGLPVAVSGANVQSITISADLGRESIYKLGQFKEFHRYVNFPLEISLEIEVLATDLDNLAVDVDNLGCSGLNLGSEAVTLNLCAPSGGNSTVYSFDLGDKVSLTSVAFNGGDTGGGNATLTYSYIAYNTFTPAGPAVT
jgi:hypothetical protein